MPRKKSLPNLYRFLRKYTPELLIGLGVLALTLSIAHRQLYDRSLRLNAQAIAHAQEQLQLDQDLRQQAQPIQIRIGELVSIGIEPGQVNGGQWSISEDQATFWSDGGFPGLGGNIVIYGHNSRNIFSRLRWVKLGQEILLTTQNGIEHRYQITEIYQVSPDRIEFLQPTETETLTVYTCTGFLDSQRFIVRAEKI